MAIRTRGSMRLRAGLSGLKMAACILFFSMLWTLFGAKTPSLAGESSAAVVKTGAEISGAPSEDASQDEAASLLDNFDLREIQRFLDQNTPEGMESLSFGGLLRELMHGNFESVFHQCLNSLKQKFFGEIEKNWRWMAQVLALGLIGAVFANFSGVFTGSQMSEAGFYVTYLLMFSFLASSFFTGVSVAGEALGNIVEFMRALVPTYFLAVSFAGGSLMSAAGYGWMLFAISAVEWLFLNLFLPLTRVYLLLILAGHLMKEDIFSKLTELLEGGLRWGIKTTAGVVLGFHLLQSMVLPYADSLKNTSVQRFISVIPGLGQGAAAISQLVMGSGVLLKNTIGVGAVIVLFILSALPILKLLILLFFYQGASAVLQPVCDKRMVSCISAVGTGCELLLRMAVTAILLFSVSLAVICMAANVTYYAG